MHMPIQLVIRDRSNVTENGYMSQKKQKVNPSK